MTAVDDADVDWLLGYVRCLVDRITSEVGEAGSDPVEDERARDIVERLAHRYPNEWRLDLDGVLDAKGRIPLTLNDRLHWAAKATKVDRVKAATRNAALAADIPHLSHVHVEMHYRPATNRFRDIDNTVATMKPIIDALHRPDTSKNVPVPFDPIVDGDDPRYLSWSPPILHPWEKGRPPSLWLILRSAG